MSADVARTSPATGDTERGLSARPASPSQSAITLFSVVVLPPPTLYKLPAGAFSIAAIVASTSSAAYVTSRLWAPAAAHARLGREVEHPVDAVEARSRTSAARSASTSRKLASSRIASTFVCLSSRA
jgi:hypothetical protein